MSVIVDRALPDIRDGLKPVHRRILYTMHISGFTPDKPYRKSVATVGETLKAFIPMVMPLYTTALSEWHRISL
jgi:DNA gyrase subunit A